MLSDPLREKSTCLGNDPVVGVAGATADPLKNQQSREFCTTIEPFPGSVIHQCSSTGSNILLSYSVRLVCWPV